MIVWHSVDVVCAVRTKWLQPIYGPKVIRWMCYRWHIWRSHNKANSRQTKCGSFKQCSIIMFNRLPNCYYKQFLCIVRKCLIGFRYIRHGTSKWSSFPILRHLDEAYMPSEYLRIQFNEPFTFRSVSWHAWRCVHFSRYAPPKWKTCKLCARPRWAKEKVASENKRFIDLWRLIYFMRTNLLFRPTHSTQHSICDRAPLVFLHNFQFIATEHSALDCFWTGAMFDVVACLLVRPSDNTYTRAEVWEYAFSNFQCYHFVSLASQRPIWRNRKWLARNVRSANGRS